MRVEVDADARPFEACRDLFDMRRLAGAVIALHHHAAVVFEARENRERRVAVEDIGGAAAGNALVGLAERRHLDRKSVVEGKSVYVRVDLGGRRTSKKKKKTEQ